MKALTSLLIVFFTFSCNVYERNNMAKFTANSNPNATTETTKIEVTDENIIQNFDKKPQITVYFDYNQSKLSQQTIEQLQKFSNEISSEQKMQITFYLEGNTDNSGRENYNLQLSKHRAESVKEYLKELGFSNNNLIVIPKGESNPVADNQSTPQLNRRVTIYIKK